METTKLVTVNDVTKAMTPLLSISAAELRAMKTIGRQLRAARLADLYEMRARLFEETDLRELVGSPLLHTVSTAVMRAAEADRNSMKFWRREAEAR